MVKLFKMKNIHKGWVECGSPTAEVVHVILYKSFRLPTFILSLVLYRDEFQIVNVVVDTIAF